MTSLQIYYFDLPRLFLCSSYHMIHKGNLMLFWNRETWRSFWCLINTMPYRLKREGFLWKWQLILQQDSNIFIRIAFITGKFNWGIWLILGECKNCTSIFCTKFSNVFLYFLSDLAARNCVVDADLTVKIGDYGISRSLYEVSARIDSRIVDDVRMRAHRIHCRVWSTHAHV
jgi:hypothetical protein